MITASHVLVVFERSRAGRRAVELADEHGVRITVAIVIPYERRTYGCCLRSDHWNQLLDEVALEEVAVAREMLGDRDPPPGFEIVPSEDDEALAAVVERLGCDLVLMPKRRWGGGRSIRRLRGTTRAEVQAVAAA
ncbi:MAG: universal stress protein [Thermoleophilia bacterium]|nr:universal stress protein [Thermoleophilia bacterium]